MINPIDTPVIDVGEEHEAAASLDGPRKLVRPRLTEQLAAQRAPMRRSAGPILAHHELAGAANAARNGSHAEIFYFQKQMQAQTLMVFVLDDGERIEGVIEWYDLHVIKVRHATRTMIYKSSIKYMFKASDRG